MRFLLIVLAAVTLISAQDRSDRRAPVRVMDSTDVRKGVPEGGSGKDDEGIGVQKEAGSLEKEINFGIYFLNSTFSDAGASAIAFETGVVIDRNRAYSLDYYHDVNTWHDSHYEVVKAWGINSNIYWVNDFESDIFRIDLGAKVGFNYMEEQTRYSEYISKVTYKSIRFGGPQGRISLILNRISFNAGYTFLVGYRDESNGDKHGTYSSLWSTTVGFHF